MTNLECINNLKQSKGTPHKRQTIAKAIADINKLEEIRLIVKNPLSCKRAKYNKIKEIIENEGE